MYRLPLQSNVKTSRSRYEEALKNRREERSEEERKAAQKRKSTIQIRALETKQSVLEKEFAKDRADIASQIKKLREESS